MSDNREPLDIEAALDNIRRLDEYDRQWAEERGLQCGCIVCQIEYRERYGDA